MSCVNNSSNINQVFVIEPILTTGDTPVVSACTAIYTNSIVSCSGDTRITLDTGVIIFNGAIYTNQNFSGNTINANNYYSGGTNLLNLINSEDITGGTFNHSSGILILTKNDSSTIIITGFTQDLFSGGTVSGNTFFANDLSATTISATTYQNLPIDIRVTGGTYNNSTGIARYTNNTGGTFDVSGFFTGQTFFDIYTTGATYSNGFIYFNRNDLLSAYTVNLSALTIDTYVTGGTLNGNILELFRNDSVQININLDNINFSGGSGHCIADMYVTNIYGCSPITIHDKVIISSGLTINLPQNDNSINQVLVRDISGDIKYRDVLSIISAATNQDVYITGFTYSSNNLYLFDNTGNTFSTNINIMTGLTVNGDIFTTTISATTFINLPIDVKVTGGTYSNGVTTFTNNTGGTFSVTGFFTGNTDVYVTGGTISRGSNLTTLNFTNNTGGTFSISSLFDTFVTGGTYSGGVLLLTNNSGNTVTITGLTNTDTYVTAFTYTNNVFTINQNQGQLPLSVLFNTTTGLTVNGVFSAITSNVGTENTTILNATGGTISTLNTINLNTNNLTATTISATTYLNIPTDIRITGGTPNNSAKTYVFTNNTGGTFTLNALSDIMVTGGTYSNGTAVFTNNTGGTFNVNGFFTSANDVYVTGGTPNNSSKVYTFINSTGGTFNVNGLTDVFSTAFTYTNNVFTISNSTGGTLSTLINTMTGLTVNGSISATTYFNLPIDVRVTGGSTNNSGKIYTFTNNTGGTFSVNGLTDITITGITNNNNTFTLTNNTGGTFTTLLNSLSGLTINGTLTSNTISATTYQNLPIDVNTTGFTYSNNLLSINNNTGGTLNVLVNTMTGLTVNGSLSATTISATTYQNLPSTAGFVPYTGATQTVNLGGFNLSAATFSGSNLTIKSLDSSSATTGVTIINSVNSALLSMTNNGNINIGSGPINTTGLGITRINQGTSTLDFGAYVGADSAIWGVGGAVPTLNNFALRINSSQTYLNATSSIRFQQNGNTVGFYDRNSWTFSPVASTVLNTSFTFTAPNHTTQTLSTSSPQFLVTMPTLQWATGNLPNQDFFKITQPSTSFVSASTATTVSTLDIEGAPNASTNSVQITSIGLLVKQGNVGTATTTSYGAYINAQSGATTNYSLGTNGDVKITSSAATATGIATILDTTSGVSFTSNAIAIRTSASIAGSRDYAFMLNDNNVGDFMIRQSASQGSNPFTGTRVLQIKQAGTVGILGLFAGSVTGVPTAVVDVLGSTSLKASLRILSGVTVTSPNNGDIWNDGSYLNFNTPISSSILTSTTVNTIALSANTITASSLSNTGGTTNVVEASSGGTLSATKQIISAFGIPASAQTQLSTVSNWDVNKNYTGTTLSNVYQGQIYYDANYLFIAVVDNTVIRLLRG